MVWFSICLNLFSDYMAFLKAHFHSYLFQILKDPKRHLAVHLDLTRQDICTNYSIYKRKLPLYPLHTSVFLKQ